MYETPASGFLGAPLIWLAQLASRRHLSLLYFDFFLFFSLGPLFFHPSSASFYLLFYVFKVTCSVMALSYWNTAVWCSQKQPCTTGRSQSDGDDEKRRPLQSGNKSFASFNAGYILIYLCARKKRGASSSLAPLFSLTHSLFFSST